MSVVCCLLWSLTFFLFHCVLLVFLVLLVLLSSRFPLLLRHETSINTDRMSRVLGTNNSFLVHEFSKWSGAASGPSSVRDNERTLSLREWTAFLSAWNLLNVGDNSKGRNSKGRNSQPTSKGLDEDHSVVSTEEEGDEGDEED
jgi:hypothetical protein